MKKYTSTNSYPFIVLFLFCLPSIIVRYVLLKEFQLVDYPHDYRGFLSGIIFSSFFFLLSTLSRKILWRTFIYLLLVFFVYGNYEYIKALGSNINLLFYNNFFDPIFISGSALRVTNKVLYLGLTSLVILIAYLYRYKLSLSLRTYLAASSLLLLIPVYGFYDPSQHS